MNTLKGLNDAIKYVESNLCNEIDFNAIYKIAGCSEYHFKRIFSYFAGMPLGEYIRTRKLSVAVELLQGCLPIGQAVKLNFSLTCPSGQS